MIEEKTNSGSQDSKRSFSQAKIEKKPKDYKLYQ